MIDNCRGVGGYGVTGMGSVFLVMGRGGKGAVLWLGEVVVGVTIFLPHIVPVVVMKCGGAAVVCRCVMAVVCRVVGCGDMPRTGRW